jgi:hypothetical protein
MDIATATELLRRGKDGVARWNELRRADPMRSSFVLSGIDLAGAALAGANLSYLNLEGARLAGATLVGADLRRTYLDGADLSGADLTDARMIDTVLGGADLRRATFFRTTLAHADLRRATLTEANLVEAWVIGGNFEGAVMDGAIFGHTYLSSLLGGASGLERAVHVARSRVSIDTILEKLPEVFLQGCGVANEDIDYVRSRSGGAISFYSVFISYSHADKPFAHRLHALLQARGIRCWLDEHDLKPGDRLLDIIDDAIRVHDRLILCCSKSSLESWWVRDEIRKAQTRERREKRDVIIPILLDRHLLDGWEDGLASDLTSRYALDFTGWDRSDGRLEAQLEKLVKALGS